jgi:hypothetical protein
MDFPKWGRGRSEYNAGDEVEVVLGSKETVHRAKIVSRPDENTIFHRTVKVLVEGETTPRKISLDRIVKKKESLLD